MSSDKEPEQPTIKVVDTGDELPGPDRPEPSSLALIANRYRVQRRIGKGGMGEVMLARDEMLGRDVAIKRMRAANPSERAIQRFLREATVQGRLEHPSIVPVHEIGRDSDGLPFFVMKKLTGESLAELVGEGAKLPVQRVLRAFVEVCHAVELAHQRGVVHRDLKPDNIMIGDLGEVYVVDWGVSKIVGEEDGDFADIGSGSGEHATGTGVAIGTPGYMAPEQVRGASDLDGRADVYTLGCLLFEILASEPLHPRGHEGLQSALAGPDARPSLRAPDRSIAPELDALCVHATHLSREDRVQTARELGERVQRYLDGDRDLALRRQLARAHFDKAREAFESRERRSVRDLLAMRNEGETTIDEQSRRVAMREAAAALALDPKLAGAAELVGRLMLEPPRETPREVQQEIAAEDVRSARAIARAGIWAVAGGLAMCPLMWWIAPSGTSWVPVLAVLLAIDLLVAMHAMKSPMPRPGLVAIANTIIVISVARMYSPLLIAPGIAASLAMAMVLTPRFSWLGSAWAIAVLMIGAILGPLALEQFDVLSETMRITSEGAVFHGPAIGSHAASTMGVYAFYSGALIAGACIAAAAMRDRQRRAHYRLVVQAWQLRQLVPAA
jgi:serine/threonine-protein kinase